MVEESYKLFQYSSDGRNKFPVDMFRCFNVLITHKERQADKDK
jgi:hypothetical protein